MMILLPRHEFAEIYMMRIIMVGLILALIVCGTAQSDMLCVAEINDTIAEVAGLHNLSLTVLSFIESNTAVYGPYSSGFYTFTALGGRKFAIVTFKLQNNWIRPQNTPYLHDSIELATTKKHYYPAWSPSGGIHAEEYKPRKATEAEIKTLIGDSAGYETLLPGESIIGCYVFEIPDNEIPMCISRLDRRSP
jgi:hypothetical protein